MRPLATLLWAACVLASGSLVAAPLPAQYADLFETGASWTLSIELTSIEYTGSAAGPNEGRGRAQMHCHVAQSAAVWRGRASLVECTEPEIGQVPSIAGVWFATNTGAWHIPGAKWPINDKTAQAEVTAYPATIPGIPKAARTRTDEGDSPETGCWRQIHQKKVKVWGGRQIKQWCTTDECSMGDEATHAVCFSAERGLSAFESDTAGGGFDLSMRAVVSPVHTKGSVTWKTAEVPKALRQALVRWLDAQNRGQWKAYAAAYGPKFKGIKRTKKKRTKTFARKAWLSDRKKMFDRGQFVAARDVEVTLNDERATVRFTQYWASPTYADVGPKTLVFTKTAGDAYQLVSEEMHRAKKWTPPLPRP